MNDTLTRINKNTHKRLKVQAAIEDKPMIELLDDILGPELDKREKESKRVSKSDK